MNYYIVPNISSIVRCVSDNEGFSVIPDFLCREAVATRKMRIVSTGTKVIENVLYFATRKKTIYQQEIAQVKAIFEKEEF